MLKKITLKKFSITTLLLFLALILYNYPEEINNLEKNSDFKKQINIYLIDENDFVSLTEVNSDSTDLKEKILDIIDALTIGSENGSALPEGFRAIIPENTKLIDYDIKDGLLKINFSKEFLDVRPEDENKMIEAIIYSLTTIKGVEKIMIFVEGDLLKVLPHSGKKLDLYLDRSYGINKIVDITSFNNVNMVTIYYVSGNDKYYYTPVSYLTNDTSDKIEIIINSLKSNRLNGSDLKSHLNYQVELKNYTAANNEIILEFNEVLLDSVYDGNLKEEVKYAISYSIYDSLGSENVIFMVDSNKIDEFRLEN